MRIKPLLNLVDLAAHILAWAFWKGSEVVKGGTNEPYLFHGWHYINLPLQYADNSFF